MKALLRLLIRGYQLTLGPLLGSQCRFHPSCSDYGLQAVEKHGAARGAVLIVCRVCRCHPWHSGGLDPVP